MIHIFVYAKKIDQTEYKITNKLASIIKKIEKKSDITFQNNNVFMDYTNINKVTEIIQ